MTDNSRRDFLRKTTYVAPAILTLSAMPAFAKNGSPNCNNGVAHQDCTVKGLVQNGKDYLINDENTGTQGNPQNRGGFK